MYMCVIVRPSSLKLKFDATGNAIILSKADVTFSSLW